MTNLDSLTLVAYQISYFSLQLLLVILLLIFGTVVAFPVLLAR
ncbi:Uncharacterized protein BM_BM424 [Brugia malayi]|uniref:Bm424 n=1 Tax=Brugia malayi TaxID=6279 RepID=A0A0K0JDT1_BRUMA|nr:Uncharacterized protein BM_BM424 [Brugia malayi]CDP94937.1 Bm424 [Brugia malayi]VIO87078.1 Uncharacterized protein BM_BM424 [Brugia malayi]